MVQRVSELAKAFDFIKPKTDLHLTLYHNVPGDRVSYYSELSDCVAANKEQFTNTEWTYALWKSSKSHTVWEIVKEFQ